MKVHFPFSSDIQEDPIVTFYGKKNIFSSTAIFDSNFEGFKIENYELPRVKMMLNKIGYTSLILRSDSNLASSSSTKKMISSRINPTIEIKNLLDGLSSDKIVRIILTGENDLDNSKLLEYLIYNWAMNGLWPKFSTVIKADLSVLITKATDYRLIDFLSESIDGRLTPDEVAQRLLDPSKVLIILDGYHQVNHLLTPHMKRILEEASQYNLITASTNHIAKEAERVLKPNIILDNTGLLPQDILKCLKNNLGYHPLYNEVLELFKSYKEAYTLCKSPTTLEMISYIALEGEEVGLKTSISSATTTSLYYDMLSLMSLKYAKTYISGNDNRIFSFPIIKFMQELAYKSLVEGYKEIPAELLLKILEPYKESIKEQNAQEVTTIIQELRLIKLNSPAGAIVQKYIFNDALFHEFMAALYLKNSLISLDAKQSAEAKYFISLNCHNNKYLQTMKFLSGLISTEENIQIKTFAMKDLWEAVIDSNELILKIPGDSHFLMIMHMLSQITDRSLVPSRITTEIDNAILKDLDKWSWHLINSHYLSETVVNELIHLLQGNKKEFLRASSILPLLNIPDIDKKNEFATVLISKTNDPDFEIAEASIRSLRYIFDLPQVKRHLLSMLENEQRITILLTIIKTLGKIGEESIVDPLLNKLEHYNSWIVIGAVDALKNLYHLRDYRDKIIYSLLQQLGAEKEKNELIIPKILESLEAFHCEPWQVINDLQNQLADSENEKETYRITNALKDISISLNDVDYNAIIDELIKKYNSFVSFYSKSKYYLARGNIIESLACLSSKADSTHLDKIFTLLRKSTSSRSELVQKASAKALGELYSISYKNQEISDLLNKALSSKYDSVKIIAIKTIVENDIPNQLNIHDIIKDIIAGCKDIELIISTTEILGDLPLPNSAYNIFIVLSTNQNEDIKVLNILTIAKLFPNFSDNTKENIIREWLDKLNHRDTSEKTKLVLIEAIGTTKGYQYKKENILKQSIINFIQDFSDTIKDSAMNAFLNLYGDNISALNNILDMFIRDIHNEPDKKEASLYSIGRLLGRIDTPISLSKINIIIDLLVTNFKEFPDSVLSLARMSNKIPADKEEAYIALNTLGDYAQSQALMRSNIVLISDLANKYGGNNLEVNNVDKTSLDNIFHLILLRGLQTNCPIIHQRLFSLLPKTEANDAIILSILKYQIEQSYTLQNKLRIVEIIKTVFGNSDELEVISNELSIQDIDLSDKFPTMTSIIDDLESFRELVINNNLDVQITENRLIISDQEYALSDSNNLEEQLENAEKIFLSLNAHYQRALPHTDVMSIYHDITHAHLDENHIQLSILHVTNDLDELTDIFVTIEYQTIYRDLVLKKISIINGKVDIKVHRSVEDNYYQLVLGEANPYIRYYIKNILITEKDEESLLSVLENCHSKQELFIGLTNAFPNFLKKSNWFYDTVIIKLTHLFPYLLKYYNWETNKAISHNQLIKYSESEERFLNLELGLSNVKSEIEDIKKSLTEVVSDFKEFKVSRETLENTLALFKAKVEIKDFPHLNEYQTSLYLTIAHELNELHAAAMVVQTEMVKNQQTGIIGNIGSFFSKISSHIPLAGSAIDLFGVMLTRLDEETQKQIAQNIANLALNAVDMAEIAKKLALAIAISRLDNDKLKSQDSILGLVKDALNFIGDVQDSIISTIAEAIASHTSSEELSEDQDKGKNDAKLIMKILISYISGGNCHLEVDWKVNFEKLNDYFHNNYVIDVVPDISDNTIIPPSIDDALDSSQTALPLPNALTLLTRSVDTEDALDSSALLSSSPVGNNDETAIPLISMKAHNPNSYNMDIYGRSVMKFMEVLPAAKYLLNNYIPILPLFKDTYIEEVASKYEYPISVTLFGLSAASVAYIYAMNPIYPIISTALFAAKDPVYKYRAERLHEISNIEDGWYKFAIYTSTDAIISASIALPMIEINSLSIGALTAQGVTTGAINYYNSESINTNIIGKSIAFIATSTALMPCSKFINMQETIPEKILVTGACVSTLSNIHYFSKFIGDLSSNTVSDLYYGNSN